MTVARQLIDYETAKELAASVALHESEQLDGDDHYVILDSESEEHPWGWGFQPVVEPYWSNKTICPYGGAWGVTVDRFNGKVQMIARTAIENDDYPILNLTLHEIGDDRAAVFKLVRQITGWTASDTKARFDTLPVVLLSGPMITVRSIHESFLSRGATTSLTQKHA